MEIRVLGAHNTEASRIKAAGLLVDGVLAIDAGSLTSSLSIDEQKRLCAVLLTHYHYDHVRDLPALGMNLYLNEAAVNVFSTALVRQALENRLLDGEMYPRFFERPPEHPTLNFNVVEPYYAIQIEGYIVLPVPVSHAIPATGFQVTNAGGTTFLYTGDTGPGLAEAWQRVSPELLVIEVTMPNRYEKDAQRTGHMTPGLLKAELEVFRQIRGYVPRILAVHMNPYLETEIAAELGQAAGELKASITLAQEGMLVQV